MTKPHTGPKNYWIPLVRYKLLLTLLIGSYNLFGQEINLRFQHITSDQGLSQNTVDCILKDSRGFMWFGTWNGLNCYDGYGFTIFKTENHTQSLSNNFVYSICEDHQANIWIATKSGLNKLITSTNQFVRFFHNSRDNNTVSSDKINIVYCDHEGAIWVGTADNGLDRIEFNSDNNQKFKITHFRNDPNQSNTLAGNEVNAITEDHDGNIWIGTNTGLSKLNRKTGQFKVFRNNPANINSITYNTVLAIYEDKSGFIWVGTMFGLNKLDPNTGNWTRFVNNPDNPKSLSHFTVNAIAEDIEGNLLVGTLGGLNRFNPSNNTFYRFPVNRNDDYCLNNEFINSIYADKQGNVWVGTDKGGINKFNTYQKEFGYFVQNSADRNSLSNNTINSVFEESHVLWIGTAGGGLNQYDRTANSFKHFKYIPHNQNSINSNFITSFCRDNKQNLWVGTWGGGLDKLITTDGTGTFKHFITTSDATSICNVFVSSLWCDEKGFLLVGTFRGLDLFYPDKQIFKHLANHPNWKNKLTEVGCILKDKAGYYWIGTRLGLYKIHASKLEGEPQDNDFSAFTHIEDNSNSLPGNYVISLCQDNHGNIWVGTYGNGISKLRITTENKVEFVNYTQKDGLCNNVVYAILEDKQGMLWLSTDNGLSRFDPEKKHFKNYYVTDGLQSNQFYWSAAYKSKEGKMYFGGIQGLNFFYPDNLKDNDYLPKTRITDLKIFNTSVNIGQWNNKRVILNKLISETSEIRLTYKENVFSLEFSALDYFLSEKIQYQYKMVDVDQDWVTVPSSRRFVTYTNLKGGVYTFLIKASNSDGIWNNEPTRLKIIISPPFWATLWFEALMFILLVISVFVYLKYRTKRLEVQKRVLEILVKERTAKIEEQKEELQVQAEHLLESNNQLAHRQILIEGQKTQLEQQNHEISEQRDKLIELNKRVQLVNQLKLRFFTNISHEFRTPLTLILGPLDKLIPSWKGDQESLNTLQLIRRNAQRLLHLINQLMEFRKIETGKSELKVSQGDITKFLENIFSSFQDLANQRKINFTYHHNAKEIGQDHLFDHEKIENIVYNLLSNAFKFTPENGKISISVSLVNRSVITETEENKFKDTIHEHILEISVKDNGIGIPDEHINNIFKRFYQVNSSESLKVRGSGIGLSLTKELVKAYRGHISVSSTKGKGSEFIVQLPYMKNDFSKKEIIEESLVTRENIQEQVSKFAEQLLCENPVATKIEDTFTHNNADKQLILVAEDNFDLRSFITASLSNEFKVIDAENGKDAYELAKTYNPQLIISDIMMPEIDGLELCSRLKTNLLTSHIPVVLLTARSSVDNKIEGLEIGADDYIPKPFDINLLIARIKNLIESRRKLKKHFSRDLQPDPALMTSSGADQQFLQKALEIVEQNFSDPGFGVEEFVEKMSISRSLLHKKLSALTDQSAGDFITSIRLKKAARLLQSSNKNISEVAYEIGFNDPKYFSRIFRKYFGTTPSEYVTNS
jgi:signal transduction histidine kinase/ligand-binding sensor domain-containing protein/CheY-like chemotaxis protein